MTWELPDRINIRDVGPRDGLQPEPPVPAGRRVELCRRLADAGLADIEAAAFVSPRAVPAMAEATDVLAGLLDTVVPGPRWWALVPNLRGAELAVEAGAPALTVTVSASERYSAANVRMSTTESLGIVESVAEVAGGRPLDVVVSCAFGSPYDDEAVGPVDVAAVVDSARDAGASEVTLADTTGLATPDRVADVLGLVGVEVGLHLHDTRGTALTNAFAAMQLGVVRFDTAVGGLGGSPFAPAAGGNLATEDLVHLCDGLGVETGIDLDLLLAASALVTDLVGHPVPSRVAAALRGS